MVKTQPRKKAILAPSIPRTNANLARVNPLYLERMIIAGIEAGTRNKITHQEAQRAGMERKEVIKEKEGREVKQAYIVVNYQSREGIEIGHVFKVLRDVGGVYTIGPPSNAERGALMRRTKQGMRGHYFRPY